MTIQELEKIMIEYGAVIRAIPYERTILVEAKHRAWYESDEKYFDCVVYYDEYFKRDMFTCKAKNSNGGKFIIARMKDQGAIVNNWGNPIIFYDTLEQAVEAIKNCLDKEETK